MGEENKGKHWKKSIKRQIDKPVFESQILFKVEAIVSGGQESDTVEESDRLARTNWDSGVKAFAGIVGIKTWCSYFNPDKIIIRLLVYDHRNFVIW